MSLSSLTQSPLAGVAIVAGGAVVLLLAVFFLLRWEAPRRWLAGPLRIPALVVFALMVAVLAGWAFWTGRPDAAGAPLALVGLALLNFAETQRGPVGRYGFWALSILLMTAGFSLMLPWSDLLPNPFKDGISFGFTILFVCLAAWFAWHSFVKIRALGASTSSGTGTPA